MLRLPRKSGLILNLLAAALLLSAQFGSLAHSFEHDPGAPQAKYCSVCATASQLSSACVDTHTHQAIIPGRDRHVAKHDRGYAGTSRILVHQRGPPPPL
jgi:hypothetical protein